MHVRLVDDPAEFLSLLSNFVGNTEARHNRILGIARSIADDPTADPDVRQWLVEQDGAVIAAAVWTPPWKLVLSEAEPAAIDHLAAAVVATGWPIAGVTGNRPSVDQFATSWSRLTSTTISMSMSLGVFSLEKVRPVPTPDGEPRAARPSDRATILRWVDAFEAEALGAVSAERSRTKPLTDRRLRGPFESMGFVVWEVDGRLTAMSSHGLATPNGIRIGPVYTAPEHRRRGFGAALVAYQSQRLIDAGHRFCFLFTDLTNPTSNAVYERIGYEQVAEAADYRFDAAVRATS